MDSLFKEMEQDSKKEKEKSRSMKISEIIEVRIGRDHTAVMRK